MLADRQGDLYISNAFSRRVVKNYLRDDIVFHRTAVTRAEETDYFYRTGFDESRMRFHYLNKDITYPILLSNIKARESLVAPFKPLLPNLPNFTPVEWSHNPLPLFSKVRYTYYPLDDLHYAYEMNCPF